MFSILITLPMIGLLFTYTEVCTQLTIWVRRIIETFDDKPFDSSRESELFTRSLEKSKNTFSAVLYVVITSYLITLIFGFYSALSTFFAHERDQHIILRFANFPFVIFVVITLWYFNCLSCDLFKTVHQLKRAILRSGIDFERKSYIIEELQCFQGFDANGFFTLNRPLLTSIISNFTTFIIVLIQFKMSENQGSEVQQPTNCSSVSNHTSYD